MKQGLQSISITILLLLIISFSSFSQDIKPPFQEYLNHEWVDSVFKTLSEEEQIAQSIWIAAWSNRDVGHAYQLSNLIEKYKIGGLIFFQGTAEKQLELINHYQSISKLPLMIAMDAEWGPGMRLDRLVDFPYQMTLGAIKNDSLIYEMGLEIARQLTILGVGQNLAPVADVNNNPANPVINYRSFGENPERVARKTIMYAKGLQDGGVVATAKHFPGHGDTETDSHYDLPVINHSKERFDTLELVPFKGLISMGLSSIMSAHLNIPAFDTEDKLPSTLSENIIEDLLKKDLGFEGLVITDAMNMKGITAYYEPGMADALAYAAGNDVLEYVEDVEKAITSIKKFREEGKISSEDIEKSCRKILALKYWSGLNSFKKINNKNIENRVNSSSAKALIRDLYKGSLTVLRNEGNVIPVKNLESTKIASLAINGKANSPFNKMVSRYTRSGSFLWNSSVNEEILLDSLSKYDLVLACITETDQRPHRNYGISKDIESFLGKLVESGRLITVYCGNPYAINSLAVLDKSEGLVLGYQDNSSVEELAAQLIFGGIGAHGKLPVTINDIYQEGFGILTPGKLRLEYGLPENAGLSSEILNSKIDSIVEAGLIAGAYPGCEVIAARKGIVVFHKTYGYHTYYKRKAVKPGDLYDLASVTKVSGPTAGLMVLDSRDLFDPDETLESYSQDFKGSDKGSLVLRDILAHQAGLYAWIPYWKNTIRENGKFKANTLKYFEKAKYSTEVSQGLYLNKNYTKKIYRAIRKSPLGEKKYLYSGLSFFIFPEIISDLSGKSYERFLKEEIYKPLGAYDITFNPHLSYPDEMVVPTELDTLFRKQLLHAYVHDEGSAMMGGLSGNAGLFSTANDLLKLFEMFRRYGSYGGNQIINPDILKEYTSYQFIENDNRRGLGFDKPVPPDTSISITDIYPCPSASASSFGHSGYTGTFAWADPEQEISYVFLSNRVYPTRENNKISNLNIRTEILQSIYDSIVE